MENKNKVCTVSNTLSIILFIVTIALLANYQKTYKEYIETNKELTTQLKINNHLKGKELYEGKR